MRESEFTRVACSLQLIAATGSPVAAMEITEIATVSQLFLGLLLLHLLFHLFELFWVHRLLWLHKLL